MELARLISLLGYLIATIGFLPLFQHLPTLPRLLFAAGLLAGIAGERTGRPVLPGWLLTTASILLFFWYGAQFSRHNPAVPVVCILVSLLAARLAAEKSPRAWLQTHAIALFALSSSSLFDLGPRFLALLALMLPLMALSLVLLTFQARGAQSPLSPQALRQAVCAGLLIPALSLMLIPLFFPILPRTQFPLWNFIQQSGVRAPGLSDTVTPGSSSQVADSGPLIFRAEMPKQEARRLYWRGVTFSRLSGLQWQRDPASTGAVPPQSARLVNQTITMEPGSSRLLIGLDLPISFTHQSGSSIPNAVWNRPLPSSRRMRYDVASAVSGYDRTPSPLSPRLLTMLPAETPPRIRQLSQEFRTPGASDQQRMEAIENWFRNGNFRYSRTDLPTGPTALDTFLFQTKSGHCEFFASGFALLARGAGLPARLVGGYFGGDYNELGSYYRVTEERAHVWVEVWINGSGWVRTDPSGLAVNADTAIGERRKRSLALQLQLVLDSFDHTWNSAVITYDFERQLQTASRIHSRLQGFTLRDGRPLIPLLALLLGLPTLIFLFLRLRKSGLLVREQRLLRRFRRIVEQRFGISRAAPLGLFDIAEQTGDRQVLEFVELYAGAVYRDRKLTDEEYRKLQLLLRSIHR